MKPLMMSTLLGAVTASNQYVDVAGRLVAYRSIGEGTPIVLCTRLSGNIDVWDPAFLDALPCCALRVITFDYSSLGHSTGEKSYDPVALARDAADLIEALRLDRVVIGDWFLGGLAAQTVLAMFPWRISHAVLISTSPPGPNVKSGEQLFYDTAVVPDNFLEDEVILFFEPRSTASRDENWHALNQQLPTPQLLTFPRAGHAPHHEHAEAAAAYIATFVRTATTRT